MTLTVEQRWEVAVPALEKAGIDTSKIAGLNRALIVGRLEADEVIGCDEDVWREWAESWVEQHSAHAKPGFWRINNARDIIDGWQSGVFGDPESEATPEELVEAGKYAVLSWYDRQSNVYPAGDTLEDVLKVVCALHFESETTEHVEGYWDLDTGELHNLYTGKVKLEVTHILVLGDHTYRSDEE